MTPPNPLTELAERVERLTGPCRETDYLICEAVHPFLAEQRYVRVAGDNGYHSSTPLLMGAEKVGPASEYTGSLDCANLLKPDNCTFALGDCNEDDGPWACVTDTEGVDYAAIGATPILAFVSANLRARAASESGT